MYICALLYVVFLTPNRYEGIETFPVNLVPFAGTIKRIHKPAGEHFWLYYINYWGNIFGNIILFIPLGYLLKQLQPLNKDRQILLYGIFSSISIELIQLFLKIGVCDIDDVLLNATGTLFGILLFRKFKILKTE